MHIILTLDPDVVALVRQRMRERGISFEEAVNEAIRVGLAQHGQPMPFRTRTARMGRPNVNLDRALQLAGELEDEDTRRKGRAPRAGWT